MVVEEAGAAVRMAAVVAEAPMAALGAEEAHLPRPVAEGLTRMPATAVPAATAAEVAAAPDIGGIRSTAVLRVQRRPRRVRARLLAILQPATTPGRNHPAHQRRQRHA